MVVLAREYWQAWLDLSKPEKDLLQPLASGANQISVTGVAALRMSLFGRPRIVEGH